MAYRDAKDKLRLVKQEASKAMQGGKWVNLLSWVLLCQNKLLKSQVLFFVAL